MYTSKCYFTHLLINLYQGFFEPGSAPKEIRCVWNIDKEG